MIPVFPRDPDHPPSPPHAQRAHPTKSGTRLAHEGSQGLFFNRCRQAFFAPATGPFSCSYPLRPTGPARDEGRRAAGDVAAIRAAAGSFGLQLHARWAAVHRRRRHGRVLEQRVRRQDDQDTAWHEHRAGLHDEAHDEDPHARTSRVTGSEGQGGAEAEGGLQGEDPRTDYEGEVQRLHCRVRVLGRGRPEMERAARRWLHHQRQGRQPHRHGQLSARRPGQQGPRRDPRAAAEGRAAARRS
ncbi:unnamed protein product, partial [Prorocentrum cordatum]